MDNPITHWAYIQSKLKEARAKALEAEGITESGLRDLEAMALVNLGEVGDSIQTEYGKVEKIYDKPVTFFVRRSTEGEPFKHKLKLLTPQEEK